MKALGAVFVILIAGCVLADNYSVERFSSGLSSSGFNAVIGDPVDQPFMEVQGRVVNINGNNIAQVFQYSDEKDAKRIEKTVSSNGSVIGKSSVLWKSPPRFYRKANVIVIYTGKDDDVASGIESLIGKPFAGQAIDNQTAYSGN